LRGFTSTYLYGSFCLHYRSTLAEFESGCIFRAIVDTFQLQILWFLSWQIPMFGTWCCIND